MEQETPNIKREQLEKAIAAQENLRGVLDDEVIDAAIAALKNQVAELSPDPVIDQQRKQVTILFMDVVSSTRLMRELDPEENLAIMDAALQKLAEPVEEFGGKVTRFMGDGFLAVFGLPRARENDPEMAVRAGLGILDRVNLIAQDLRTKYDLEDFQIRVGVNTGLVVAGGVTEAEGTIMGAAVNLAARLESAAPSGGLLISQYTYAHVRGIFNFNPGDSIKMKGFPESVRVYLVQGAKPHAFRVKSRGIEGIDTPMIGREEELKTLQDTVEAIIHTQSGRFVTVVGEAGVGKSRLLVEFENWLSLNIDRVVTLKGRATLEKTNLPYSLLRDLFRAHFGIMDDDQAPEVRKKITDRFREALGEAKEFEMHAHFVGQLLGYDFRDSPYLQGVLDAPQQIRDRALVYLIDFLKSSANGSPMMIFLDDIHWADDSSLDILDRIGKALADYKVLFVALARPSLLGRRPSWGDRSFHQMIELSPLSQLDSEQMLEQVLQKVDEIPVRLRELIITNAEGNPFYLEELIKMLLEEGVITKHESIWQVQPDRLLTLNVPPTLTGVIQARLDRLPALERRVLQQASVVGKVFWDAAVSYIDDATLSDSQPGEKEFAKIGERLGSLRDRDMIYRLGASAFSDAAEYTFKSAVLQDVTYESVLIRIRRTYHALVAEWLIAHSGDRVGEVTGLIAGHLEKAGKNKQALEFLGMAAEQAASNYAIEEAADFYTRALALTSEDDLERQYTLLIGLGTAVRMRGNRDRHKEILSTLADVADALDDERKRLEVLIQKAWFGFWTSNFSAGQEDATQAVKLSKNLGDKPLSVQAYYVWVWFLMLVGDIDQALVQAEKALSIVEQVNDKRLKGNILNLLGSINNAMGDFTAALGYLEVFLSISREIGDQEREITALNNHGISLTRLGDFDRARENFQQILDIVQETGDRSAEGTAFINLGWVAAAQGEWDLARKNAEKGIALKREHGQVEAMAEGLLWLGHAWQGLNQPDKAVRAYRESLEIRQELDQQPLIMGIHAALVRVAFSQGDLKLALDHANKILAFLDGGGDLSWVWEPVRIYLSCYQALKLGSDPRADEILNTAHELLQEQASLIEDPAYLKMFMENIPWHREIIQLWEER